MKKFFVSDIFLGTMIAVLSVFTAFVSYQGSMSDSDQNKYEILGMQQLNDGNAEYLRANQDITQDYNYFDNWYLNADERPDIAQHYWKNQLWSPSYFAASCGGAPLEIIKQYVEQQNRPL